MECPNCHEEMYTDIIKTTYYSGVPEDALVHRCPKGCGVWIPTRGDTTKAKGKR